MNKEQEKQVEKIVKDAVGFSGYDSERVREHWNDTYKKTAAFMKGADEKAIFERTIRSFVATIKNQKTSRVKEFEGVILGVGALTNFGENMVKSYRGRYDLNPEQAIRDKIIVMKQGIPTPVDPKTGKEFDESQFSLNIYGFVDIDGNHLKFVGRAQGVKDFPIFNQKIPVGKVVRFKGTLGDMTKTPDMAMIYNVQSVQSVASTEDVDIEEMVTEYFGKFVEISKLQDYFNEQVQRNIKRPRVVVKGIVTEMNPAQTGGVSMRIMPETLDFEDTSEIRVFVVPEKKDMIDFAENSTVIVAGELWLNTKVAEGKEPVLNLTPFCVIAKEKVLANMQTNPDEAAKAYDDEEEQ